MIVVTVSGGLGNQLFQYAFGRSLSLRTGRRLRFDLSLMPSGSGDFARTFLLDRFPSAEVRTVGARLGRAASEDQRGNQRVVLARGLLRRALAPLTVIEPSDVDVLLQTQDIPARLAILQGHWQSPAYFDDIAALIRTELRPGLAVDSPGATLLRQLEGHEIISVHVRRGDYVKLDHIARMFPTMDAPQVMRMGAQAAQSCEDPAFLVFSDDPAWAQEHLRFDAPMLHADAVATLSSVEVLALMSRAQHHVIANSSLSWWGAWLAEPAGQTVIAPRSWFAHRDIDPLFRFPPHWQVV
jgi:hypothetical protein